MVKNGQNGPNWSKMTHFQKKDQFSKKQPIFKKLTIFKKCSIFTKIAHLKRCPIFTGPDLKRARRTSLSARRARRTKSRGPPARSQGLKGPFTSSEINKDDVQSQWDWLLELASNCCQTSRCINPASMPSLIAGSRLSWSNHIPIHEIHCILFYVSLHFTILTNTFCHLGQYRQSFYHSWNSMISSSCFLWKIHLAI